MRTPILSLAVAFALTRAVRAQTAPYSISITPQASCFNLGGTIPIQIFGTNTSSGALTDFKVNVCSEASVIGVTPGSANEPPGGSSVQTTCSLGIGATFTASGSWPAGQTNGVFVGFAVPTNAGPTLPFLFSVSDSTHPPVSTTFGMPQCAVGPVLQITKSISQENLSLGQARVGDKVEFEFVVTNIGTVPTSGDVKVTDEAPDGLHLQDFDFGTFDSSCNRVGENDLACFNRGPIPPGQSRVCKAEYVPTKAGDFENTATVQGGGAPSKTSAPVSLTTFGSRPNPQRVPIPTERVLAQSVRPIP